MADQSPAAKDAAIAKLKAAEPNIHFDTAYGILRGDPAFDPNDLEERNYILQHWASAGEPQPKQAEAPPPQ